MLGGNISSKLLSVCCSVLTFLSLLVSGCALLGRSCLRAETQPNTFFCSSCHPFLVTSLLLQNPFFFPSCPLGLFLSDPSLLYVWAVGDYFPSSQPFSFPHLCSLVFPGGSLGGQLWGPGCPVCRSCWCLPQQCIHWGRAGEGWSCPPCC